MLQTAARHGILLSLHGVEGKERGEINCFAGTGKGRGGCGRPSGRRK